MVKKTQAGCAWLLSACMMVSPMMSLAERQVVSAGTIIVTPDMVEDTDARYTLTVNGVETPLAEGTYENATLTQSEAYGQFGSSSQGDAADYAYRSALYVDAGGVNEAKSALDVIQGGKVYDTKAEGFSIVSTSDSFSGVIVDGAEYTISDASLTLDSASDGSNVNDFTGLGTAIINANQGILTLLRTTIKTSGVAKLALLTDSGAATLVQDSEISVRGGTLYDGYINNSNMATMVSPPWVLGIAGNARLSNIEGKYSLLTVVNSKLTSSGWGTLSTDSGSDMQIVTVDSEISIDQANTNYTDDPYLDLYGTGYGVFAIGQAQEFFYGTQINAGMYGGVITGGYMTFADSDFDGGTLDVKALSGDAATYDFLGHEVTGFADKATFTGITGKGQNTELNSDGFGIMTWGTAGIKLTDGTVFNTDEAAFLLKSPDVTIQVEDGSQLNAKNGILVQMIDDENNMIGADAKQNFNTEYTEDAGWPSENGGITETSKGGYVTFNAENVSLSGDLYNGTGYRGQDARSLLVNIGSGAALAGDICATEVIHVGEQYDGTNALISQNTSITSDQYYYIGRVANRSYFTGNNFVQVRVTDGGVWKPQKSSLITYLQVDGQSAVYAEITDNGDGTFTLTPSEQALTNITYGAANELVQVSGGFSFGDMGDFDPSAMGGFDPSKMGDFDPSALGDFDPSQMEGFDPSTIDFFRFGGTPPEGGMPNNGSKPSN